jgi:myosin heavy subunit
MESSNIPNVSDTSEFQRIRECLQSVCDTDCQLKLFQLLSGILHLGNVEFEENESGDQVSSITNETKDFFRKVCCLFGFEEEELFNCLTKQNMYVNNNIIVKVQNLSQVSPNAATYLSSYYLLPR